MPPQERRGTSPFRLAVIILVTPVIALAVPVAVIAAYAFTYGSTNHHDIRAYHVGADDRRIEVAYEHGACDTNHKVVAVEQSSERVVLAVVSRKQILGNCTMQLNYGDSTVTLDEPLGSRQVLAEQENGILQLLHPPVGKDWRYLCCGAT